MTERNTTTAQTKRTRKCQQHHNLSKDVILKSAEPQLTESDLVQAREGDGDLRLRLQWQRGKISVPIRSWPVPLHTPVDDRKGV